MPTLMELCSIPKPEHLEFDGKSIVPLLAGNTENWPERTLFVHNQRVIDPVKWKQTSVMTDRWRLLDNTELYDILEDPGQNHNIISQHPEVAESLRIKYDEWWNDISRRFDETTPLYVGSEHQNPVQLNAHDWMTSDNIIPPWNQPHILERLEINGPWHVRVTRAGRYRFILRERPETADFPLTATEARLVIGDKMDMKQAVNTGSTGVQFEADLPAGDTKILTWLYEKDGSSRGAYFVDVERLERK
jgi:hypothetical protein